MLKCIRQKVVNCFQITMFVPLGTSEKSPYLCDTGCELLSNYYVCTIRDIANDILVESIVVVNCFQITMFVPLGTSREDKREEYGRL